MPTFLGEEKVQEIFVNTHPSECLLQLRRGLAELGIIQVLNGYFNVTQLIGAKMKLRANGRQNCT